MSWSKFVYHSLLTVVLGVTLSVCSNVMETDDFEIEAIASGSGYVLHGSTTITGENTTINFSKTPHSLSTRALTLS